MAESPKGYERLPLLGPADLNREQMNVYEQMEPLLKWAKESGFKAETEDGLLLGPFNAFVYSPEIGSALNKYLKAEQDATCVSARVREVVILTVGAAFQSDYERYAHRAVALKAGLAQADVEALAEGREAGPESQLSEDERITQTFVKQLATDHRVSDEVYAQALKAFGHKGLVDIVHLAGMYMTVSSMLNAFRVPVPE